MISIGPCEIEVPGEAHSLALIRMVVTSLAEMAGMDENRIGEIELAVDEACSNVVDHAYRGLNPHPNFNLSVYVEDNNFVIDVVDRGKAFNFSAHILPKFPDHWDEGNVRGVGLFLIRKTVDEVSYEQLPDKRNRLRLVKHVRP
ncbi:MAG: ATP-binding protein [Kiritimatiellia bacterium]